MGIGTSLILIAVGAILKWAVSADVSGIDIQMIGLILFIIGIAGLVLSLVLWTSVGTWVPGRRVRTRRAVVREDIPAEPVVEKRTVVRDEGPIDPLP